MLNIMLNTMLNIKVNTLVHSAQHPPPGRPPPLPLGRLLAPACVAFKAPACVDLAHHTEGSVLPACV